MRMLPVSDAEFACLELCDGSVDFDLPFLSTESRDVIQSLITRGLIEICGQTPDASNSPAIDPAQQYKRYTNRFIAGIHWSITRRCNYRCKHCLMDAGSDRSANEPSFHEIEAIIDQIAVCGIPSVSLTGGEPLVRDDFLDIVASLSDHDILLSEVYTNGSLVTESLLESLETLGQKPTFVISFDGVGCHDWLRGIEGAEQAVERAIRLITSHDMRVYATMTLHSGNADRILETALKLAEWGATSLQVSAMYDEGRWGKRSSHPPP